LDYLAAHSRVVDQLYEEVTLDASLRAGFDRSLNGGQLLSVVVNSLCGVTVVTHFSTTEIVR
jgi:hypothetical protein